MRQITASFIICLFVANVGAAHANKRRFKAKSRTAGHKPLIVAITGGPGVGKTSVLEALSGKGYVVIPEAARQIIQQQQRVEAKRPGKTGVLPWTNLAKFNDRVVNHQTRAERKARRTLRKRRGRDARSWIALADRSLLDVKGYLQNGGHDPKSVVPKLDSAIATAGYAKTAFLLDPLPYKADAQRKETPEEAARVHAALEKAYKDAGFNVINVPTFGHLPVKKSVAARAQFIEEAINKLEQSNSK